MRSAIAAAMTRSKREIPHYYLATTIDMGPALAWLTAANLERAVPDRLLYGVQLIKAVALALREVPELNGFFKDGGAAPSDRIHVGVAISLRSGGVVAPALHDVDRLALGELMVAFRDLVTRARAGSLRSSELVDATITITSLGENGAETVFGVIHPPQVALVGFGRIVQRPAVVDGAIHVRPTVSVTLSADHRVTDGNRGSKFLSAIDRLLQAPERL
jgi:pyruvate dehydrogenase E2 component (dihydrolipoamide acetyltransferase)